MRNFKKKLFKNNLLEMRGKLFSILFLGIALFPSLAVSYQAATPNQSSAITQFTDSKITANTQHKDFSTEIKKTRNTYQPFIAVGGAKYFHQSSTAAAIYDFFIPLLQADDQLLFTDLRIFDRSGSQFEGNAHLGYRKLYPATNQIFGVYGAFDRKITSKRNFFNQLTFGFEYWQDQLFIGGNIYQPIGITKKPASGPQTQINSEYDFPNITAKTQIIISQNAEKTLAGADMELGYAVTDKLTTYAGGYYFAGSDARTIAGPKLRLTYDYIKPSGRILGIFDGIGIEAGAQYDTPRKASGYIGIKLKIGLTSLKNTSNVQGFARHMVELVRRDPDIVAQETSPIIIKQPAITTKIGKKHIIDYFGITPEISLPRLAEIYYVLGLMEYSNDKSDIAIPYYFDLLNVIAIESVKSYFDKAKNYYSKISATVAPWLHDFFIRKEFINDKLKGSIPDSDLNIINTNLLKTFAESQGISNEKEWHDFYKTQAFNFSHDQNGKNNDLPILNIINDELTDYFCPKKEFNDHPVSNVVYTTWGGTISLALKSGDGLSPNQLQKQLITMHDDLAAAADTQLTLNLNPDQKATFMPYSTPQIKFRRKSTPPAQNLSNNISVTGTRNSRALPVDEIALVSLAGKCATNKNICRLNKNINLPKKYEVLTRNTSPILALDLKQNQQVFNKNANIIIVNVTNKNFTKQELSFFVYNVISSLSKYIDYWASSTYAKIPGVSVVSRFLGSVAEKKIVDTPLDFNVQAIYTTMSDTNLLVGGDASALMKIFLPALAKATTDGNTEKILESLEYYGLFVALTFGSLNPLKVTGMHMLTKNILLLIQYTEINAWLSNYIDKASYWLDTRIPNSYYVKSNAWLTNTIDNTLHWLDTGIPNSPYVELNAWLT